MMTFCFAPVHFNHCIHDDPYLRANHRHWWHAWPGHHGHWLGTRLVHRPRLLLPNSGSSHAGSAGSNATSHAHSSHAHAGHTAGPWHCLLLWPAGLGTDLGRSEEALGLGHRGHEVASHAHPLHAALCCILMPAILWMYWEAK